MTSHLGGYWPSAWPGEDGGPMRQQVPHGAAPLDLARGGELRSQFRSVMATTMLVHRDPGELYALIHTLGTGTTARVERIDPESLEPQRTSPELPGGPMWPGGVAVTADGHLLVVYGRFAHRLDPVDLQIVARRELPRERPYNSFVLLADGTLVTKDFAKDGDQPSQLLALDPETLEARADALDLPERSIARLSATGDTVYAVGDTSVLRVPWDGSGAWALDARWRPTYRTQPGQTYGWDAVLAAGAAWFLDDGEGSDRYAGTFRGQGISTAPLHLVRADLDTGEVTLAEICGEPGGLIANPPVVDTSREIAVGFDSANARMRAFTIGAGGQLEPRWDRHQDHACHMVLYPESGELVTHDHDPEAMADHLVVLAVDDGQELGRVATGAAVQSVVFPAPGFGRDVYSVSFAGIARVWVD